MPVDGCICGHNCRRGSCIPQREYDRPRTDPLTEYELREVIWFSVRGTCGYHLGDALRKAYTGLDGRDNRVFTRAKSSISIRLEVRLTHRKIPTVALNLAFSGLDTRNGRNKSVPTPFFHRGVIDRSYRSEP